MKSFRRVLAGFLCLAMVVGLISAFELDAFRVNRATAAGTDPVFDEEEFGMP